MLGNASVPVWTGLEEVDFELLAGERTGEKPERYDENLGQIPPPHAAGMAPIFLLSFSKSEHAPVIPSERAARARDLLFAGEQSKGSAFHRSSAYLNSRSLATRACSALRSG